MRFATDDRVTVTDPKHWNYGEQGIVQEWDYALLGSELRYWVSFDDREPILFTADQLDFTEERKEQ